MSLALIHLVLRPWGVPELQRGVAVRDGTSFVLSELLAVGYDAWQWPLDWLYLNVIDLHLLCDCFLLLGWLKNVQHVVKDRWTMRGFPRDWLRLECVGEVLVLQVDVWEVLFHVILVRLDWL